MRLAGRSLLYLFGFLFLISGAAGLIYEIVWERLLELYFGVTNVSVTLIVAAYMAGLGLGSLFGGKLSSRLISILFAYGLVEIGIGLFGLVSPGLIVWIGAATAGSAYVIVFLISFAILLVPTFLMGMTLPLLAQAFVSRVDRAGEIVGLLYGINTLGAAIGSFLAGYVLIGQVGLDKTVYIACSLNAAVGFAALLMSRYSKKVSPDSGAEESRPNAVPLDQTTTWNYRTIILVSFLVGFLGLAYEMLWIRILGIINKNTVYGFPSILGVFLIGLAWGGYYFGRKADKTRNPVQLFWRIEVSVAIVSALAIFTYWMLMQWPPVAEAIHSVFRNAQRPGTGFILIGQEYVFSRRALITGLAYYFLPILWIVFPASFLMGAGLPVLDRIAINSAQVAGQKVGTVHLANIAGSVCGAILVSFAFLPWFGTELTLKILVLLSLIFLFVGAFQKARKWTAYRLELILIAIVLLIVIILPAREEFYVRYFQAGTNDASPVVREYADSVLAWTPPYLWIAGDEHGSYPADGTYESHPAACVSVAHPKRVLIIGFGGGNTAYFFTKVPGIEEIVIVELMQGLNEFLDVQAPTVHELLSDPRVKYIDDDGRRYLYAHPSEKFDLISTDPLRNFSAGHNNLYSVEAQRLYLAHLNPGGVYCQWYDEAHHIPKVTASVFPEVDSFKHFTIASNRPIRYDVAFMRSTVDSYLRVSQNHVTSEAADRLKPEAILFTYLRNGVQIRTEEQSTPLMTDFTPWLEYYLARPPISNAVKPWPQVFEDFIGRLDGCDDVCLARFYQRLEKLRD